MPAKAKKSVSKKSKTPTKSKSKSAAIKKGKGPARSSKKSASRKVKSASKKAPVKGAGNKGKAVVNKKAKAASGTKSKSAVKGKSKAPVKRITKKPVAKAPKPVAEIAHGENQHFIPAHNASLGPLTAQDNHKAENVFHEREEVALHQENQKIRNNMATRTGKRIFRVPRRS